MVRVSVFLSLVVASGSLLGAPVVPLLPPLPSCPDSQTWYSPIAQLPGEYYALLAASPSGGTLANTVMLDPMIGDTMAALVNGSYAFLSSASTLSVSGGSGGVGSLSWSGSPPYAFGQGAVYTFHASAGTAAYTWRSQYQSGGGSQPLAGSFVLTSTAGRITLSTTDFDGGNQFGSWSSIVAGGGTLSLTGSTPSYHGGPVSFTIDLTGGTGNSSLPLRKELAESAYLAGASVYSGTLSVSQSNNFVLTGNTGQVGIGNYGLSPSAVQAGKWFAITCHASDVTAARTAAAAVIGAATPYTPPGMLLRRRSVYQSAAERDLFFHKTCLAPACRRLLKPSRLRDSAWLRRRRRRLWC